MKGWVYIITNKAMPGLIKIGYSMKDPEIRANELNHTGTPHPYKVEYEILIEAPHKAEQKIHLIMKSNREGKEWFRYSPEEAIKIINESLREQILIENFKNSALKKSDIEQAEKTTQQTISNQEHEWIISKSNNLYNKTTGITIQWNDYKIEGTRIISRGQYAQSIPITAIDPQSMNSELIEYLKSKKILI